MDVLPLPKRPTRDWSELPFDALYSIFENLGVVDLLMGAGLVCHSWLEVAKEPDNRAHAAPRDRWHERE